MLSYISYSDLVSDIRKNLDKIPKDVIGVAGIPRSGMLAATIIAEYLNVGLSTVDDLNFKHGFRDIKKNDSNKVLVVDDTCYFGNSIQKTKELLKDQNYEFIYLVVYLEGTGTPDIYLRDVRNLAKQSDIGIVLYEWNIFHHKDVLNRAIFDLDGVLCVEPPDERNTEAYQNYIKNPIPLFIPTVDKINIATYRLKKYQNETVNFLQNNNLNINKIYMIDCDSYEERSKISPEGFKSVIYDKSNCILFIESSDWQAREIARLTGKAVYCTDTNKMY